MKKRLNRVWAMALSLVMVITGIQVAPNQVKGAGEESSNLPTSQEITQLNAPEKAYLCDFRTGSGGFKIVFEDADEEVYQLTGTDKKSFDIYVGGEKTATVNESGTSVDIENWGFTDGETYEITVKQVLNRTNAQGETETLESPSSAVNYFTYTTKEADSIDTGIAKVYVTTTRDAKTRNHDLYKAGTKVDVKSSLVVYNADGTIDSEGSGTIKLRGNSTSTGQKKPFNIKFDSKTNVFGFGKAKKWSLLANTFDKSLIRNQIGIQFHHKIMEANQPYKFTSECEPIDFYLDGHYMGAYLLLESVEAGSSRVDIDAENPDNHEILLELDMTDRDAAADAHLDAHTTRMNMSFTINEPEGPGTEASDVNHEDHQEWVEFNQTYAAKKTYALEYLNNLEAKIENGGDGTLDEIGQLIDVDSFVNYYITAELFRITDVSYSSVRYFIKQSDDGTEKLYAGPLWDLDLSSGNADGAAANPDNDMHAQNNPWFGALMKNKAFAAKVTERFNQVLPEIKKLVAEGGVIDTLVNTLRKSIDANYSDLAYNKYSIDKTGVNTGWGIDKLYTAGEHECATAEEARATGNVSGSLNIYDNYDGYVNDFKSYMTGRIAYLKKQFDATDYEEVLTDIESQMGSYAYNLAKKKETSIYKSCHNEGKLEYLNDGQLDNGYLALTNADTSDAWGSENGEAVYATIDLGKYYKAETIDKIVIQYKDGAANDTVLDKAYKIQYSINGKDFRDITDTEKAVLDENNRTVDEVSSNTGTVRYVRVYFPKQAGYGMQIREFAVLDTDKNAATVEGEEVADVTNLVLTTPADNQIGVLFDAVAVENATYIIYVDGEKTVTEAVPGEINIINNIKTGKHTVKVEVMNANGFVSAGVSDTVTVTGPITLDEMVLDSNFNIAYGTDATYSSWKEGVNSSKAITDGIIDDHNNYVGVHVDADHNDTGYFQINLTNDVDVNAIDEIAVWYRDGRENLSPTAIGYSIQYSEDGEVFHTVKTVSADEMPDENKNQETEAYITMDDMGETASPVNRVKSIRVIYNGNIGWGAQVREIAVLDKTGNAGADREQIEIDLPEITVFSDSYNTITTVIASKAGQEDYVYTIYLDGKAMESDVTAGTYIIKDVAEGEHTVSVRADYGGVHSDSVSQNVQVKSAFSFTQSVLTGRLLSDVNENGNNYLRFTGISAQASSGDGTLAIDNLADTRWESSANDSEEIVIDLGAQYIIKEVAAVWETASSKDYTLQFSADGEEYTTVATVKDQTSLADRYDRIVLTETTEARFVKLNGTARTTGYGHSIWEMAVYGPDEQKEYESLPGKISSDLDITGYQISTSFGGEEGKTGIRTIYQREELVENQEISEFGLIMGYTSQLSEPDKEMLVGNDSEFIVVYPATEDGKSTVQMGDSPTALYYVRTMDIAGGYDVDYSVRAYAKLTDGSIVYSTVKTFNVFNVAKNLYDTGKMPNYNAHQSLYEDIISKVDNTVEPIDYNWNNTLVNKPEVLTDDLNVEGYQMSGSLGGVEGKLGLRVVYSVEGQYEEVGLIYGLVYGDTPITEEDMVLDRDNVYVKYYEATEAGKLNIQLGASNTAQYYARTMSVSGLSKQGYTVPYMVRVYGKTVTGDIVYGNVYTYNINEVASNLYDNDLMSTANAHNAVYTQILTKVNPDYREVNYNWSNAIAK